MRRVPLWSVALAVLVLAGLALAQGYQPDFRAYLVGLARTSDLQITTPLSLYVAAGGNDTGPCSLSAPCATYQAACNQVAGREISDDVVIQGTAGFSGTGCYLMNVKQGQHSLVDGGVKRGTLKISGARAEYVARDGGTGSAGTITAATAGAKSTCALDSWTTSNVWEDGELANKWILITSGTGSDTDHLWPIRTNVGGVLTVNDNGRATQPVNGSGYQIYDAPSVVITGGLGQSITTPAPEGDGASVTPAFVITSGESVEPLSGAKTPKWISLEDFKVTGSATILVDLSGPVEVRHNLSTATTTSSQLVRTLPGVYRAGIHRNILTGTGRFLQARYAATAGVGAIIEDFNNVGPGPTSDKTFGVGFSGSVWSEGNFFPLGSIRAGGCVNCRSLCDVWGGIRRTSENDPGTSGRRWVRSIWTA
jgi:hypothetical protein